MAKITTEIVKKVISEKNATIADDWYYLNAIDKFPVKCEKGHIFKTCWNYIQQKKWCPKCAKLEKTNSSILIEEKTRNIVEFKKGKIVDGWKYKNGMTPFWIECKKDHCRWKIRWNNIQQGNWCPECAYIRSAKKRNITTILSHWKTGEDLPCMASYETKTVEYFNKNKIDFLWQSKTFLMPNNKTYRPDAYLINENKWIEIKGYFWGQSKEKWDWFHKEYPNSDLWNGKKLKEIGILK